LFFVFCILYFFFLEEECYNSLTSLVSSKNLVFVTQTKLLYEVTWKTVLNICRKHVVRTYNLLNCKYYNSLFLILKIITYRNLLRGILGNIVQ